MSHLLYLPFVHLHLQSCDIVVVVRWCWCLLLEVVELLGLKFVLIEHLRHLLDEVDEELQLLVQ